MGIIDNYTASFVNTMQVAAVPSLAICLLLSRNTVPFYLLPRILNECKTAPMMQPTDALLLLSNHSWLN